MRVKVGVEDRECHACAEFLLQEGTQKIDQIRLVDARAVDGWHHGLIEYVDIKMDPERPIRLLCKNRQRPFDHLSWLHPEPKHLPYGPGSKGLNLSGASLLGWTECNPRHQVPTSLIHCFLCG